MYSVGRLDRKNIPPPLSLANYQSLSLQQLQQSVPKSAPPQHTNTDHLLQVRITALFLPLPHKTQSLMRTIPHQPASDPHSFPGPQKFLLPHSPIFRQRLVVILIF